MPVSKNKPHKSKMKSFGLRKQKRRQEELAQTTRSSRYDVSSYSENILAPVLSLVALNDQLRKRRAKPTQEATNEDSSESRE